MKVKFVLGLVLSLLFAGGCATRVGPGHVGIKIDLAGSQRGAEDLPIKTGWVFYNPASSTVVEYPTYVQTARWTHEGDKNEELSFNTSQGLQVFGDVSISYQLTAARVPQFYVTFRNDDIENFTHGYLRNQAREAVNKAASQYTVEEIMGSKKSEFEQTAVKALQAAVEPLGVQILQFGFIGSPRPPESVVATINAKVQAQQIALQKQTELQQAQAEAAKSVAYATGEANATTARAEGNAKANRLLNDSLTDKVLERARLDVQLQWIEKWNGATPSMVTGGNNGLLLNVSPGQK